MLNFRNTIIALSFILLGLMAYDYQHEVPVWAYILPVLFSILLVSWGCYFIQSGFFVKALYSGPENKNEIAITFDDGPHENTPVILDILKRHNVKAAFFCIGKNIPGKEGIVKRISSEGHVLGNHSFAHSNLIDFYPLKKLLDDVSRADEIISQTIDKRTRLFRPPYGVTTPTIARMVKEKKYYVIGWSVRSYDTSIKNRDKLLRRIFTRMKNGSVILVHDSTPGIEIVLEKVLEKARTMNLKVVGIEELFGIKAYESS